MDGSLPLSRDFSTHVLWSLIFLCQATGEDFNIEAGDEKRPFRALLDVGLVRTTTGNRVFGALKVILTNQGFAMLHTTSAYEPINVSVSQSSLDECGIRCLIACAAVFIWLMSICVYAYL